MSFWAIHLQINVLIFLSVIFFITISNIIILRKLGSYPKPLEYPSVSVLVPARNEEKNIRNCINSLLNQDYPNYEVLVLDDNSTDGTWQILTELSEKSEKLRIIKGEPLPSEWFGKHWACHQLSKYAKGEILLFTDADTIHYPNSIRDGVAGMLAEKADFITAFPREQILSWGERLMVPLFPWFILCFLPLIVAYRTQSPAFSAAIGQYLMINRKAYEKIGGYESIKNEAVDDVALVRKIKANGLRWRMSLGYDQLFCRMYSGFRDAYRGFTKNLFAGFGYRVLTFIFVWICIGFSFLQPVVLLLVRLAGVKLSSLSLVLSVIGVFLSLMIWGMSHWRFRFPIYLAFLYPISVILLLTIAFGSMILAITGKAVWKGRYFVKPKIIWR